MHETAMWLTTDTISVFEQNELMGKRGEYAAAGSGPHRGTSAAHDERSFASADLLWYVWRMTSD
jgi:hypothetical protein